MPKHVLHRWLTGVPTPIGRHSLVVLSEVVGARVGALDDLRTAVRSHYVDPKLAAKRIAALGAPKTAKLLRAHLPTTKKARSGDLGEILATEVAEQHLAYTVPIRRLRWKDGRDVPLRGDDIVGITRGDDEQLVFLKGEAKSRASLSKSVVTEASTALARDDGRPTRHSVLFVADRLYDEGRDELAQDLEEAVLQGFREVRVEHLLFVFTGTAPEALLLDHLKPNASRGRPRYAVGVHVTDHGDFIEHLYGSL